MCLFRRLVLAALALVVLVADGAVEGGLVRALYHYPTLRHWRVLVVSRDVHAGSPPVWKV